MKTLERKGSRDEVDEPFSKPGHGPRNAEGPRKAVDQEAGSF